MAEPITLATAKTRLGITSTHRDAEITSNIKAARMHIESHCSLALISGPVTKVVRAFDGDVPIRVFPVNTITTIAYTDTAGVDKTIASPRLIDADRPAVARPAFGTSWPTDVEFPAKITVAAGDWTNTQWGAVPEDLIEAMLLLVSHWFENHEAVVVGKTAVTLPLGVQALCNPYRTKFS